MTSSLIPSLDPRLIALVILVSVAAVWDIYARRIPNSLITAGAATSFFLLVQSQGWMGIADWISGGALLLALFLIPYAMGILGGGDVKLMATIGCFLGPTAALWNGLLCAISGGVLSIMILFFLPWGRTVSRIPYGVSIALGTLTFIAL
jgi:prepilin peptidase CpaA